MAIAAVLGSGICAANAGASVYWSNFASGSTIGRANLDGTSPNQTFINAWDAYAVATGLLTALAGTMTPRTSVK